MNGLLPNQGSCYAYNESGFVIKEEVVYQR